MAWNNPLNSSRRRGGGFTYFPPAIKFLLVANVGIYFLQLLLGPFHTADGAPLNFYIERYGALWPLGANFHLWQPITYMFLHEGFMHVLVNMLALYWVGVQVENAWGTKEFLIYYTICGLGGAAAHLLLSATLTGSVGPLVGASGAVFGVLVAFGLLFPDQTMIIFPLPIPIKAKYLVIGYIALEIFSLNSPDNIGHLAHLGGAVTGLVYWFVTSGRQVILRKQRQANFRSAWGNQPPQPPAGQSGFFRKPPQRDMGGMVDAEYQDIDRDRGTEARTDSGVKQARVITQEEIDRILDKIAATGYQNLSDEERDILFEASKRMEERR